jgi:hypothetical protein
LTDIIVKLADDPEMRGELGRKARAYAECNFERDAVLRKIFSPLEGHEATMTHDVAA